MTTDRNSERPFAYMKVTLIGPDEYDAPIYVLPPGHELPEGSLALYTTPPATIPVAGLEALVERLRGFAAQSVPPRSEQDEGYRKALIYCADELAQLIQEAK